MRRIVMLLGLVLALRSSVAEACDDTPTGIDRERVWLHFKMPAGLMPDDQFDGLPAKLEVNHVRPVYAHGKCPPVLSYAAVRVHGRSVNGPPPFDLLTPGLSTQEALAWAGIESFAPSLLGYGKSTRFENGLNDPCNASLPGLQNGVCPTPDVGCDFSPVPAAFPLDVQGTFLKVNPLAAEHCAH